MPPKKKVEKEVISFRTAEVAHLVGATRSRLDYWDRTGVLSPSLKPASGKGSFRLYSVEDILALKILVRLLKSRLPLQRIRSSFKFIRKQSKSLDSLFVTTDGKTVYFYENDNVLVDTLKQGQTVLRIAVQDLISEVQSGIKKRKKREPAK